MPNGSLDSHIFKTKNSKLLNWQTRYRIILRTTKGLHYLHEQCRECIIHCDIKPNNVLLDVEFYLKVADFGLAKLMGGDFSRVLTSMKGTRGYLTPEWISGVARTAKADFCSFRMMLFEFISGTRNSMYYVEGNYLVVDLLDVTEYKRSYIGKIASDIPLRERLTIFECQVTNVRQDVKELKISMLREFAKLETKLDKLIEHEGVGVHLNVQTLIYGNSTIWEVLMNFVWEMRWKLTLKGIKRKKGWVAMRSPGDKQSRLSIVDDAGVSVEIIKAVSPSKFPIGRCARNVATAKQMIDIKRQDRKDATAITTSYNVEGLRKIL
nr:proline-rich receptor-like protein kinase PERK1 [Ziziphus jujuba var. spinosa]